MPSSHFGLRGVSLAMFQSMLSSLILSATLRPKLDGALAGVSEIWNLLGDINCLVWKGPGQGIETPFRDDSDG
jgi:hypothetical protein